MATIRISDLRGSGSGGGANAISLVGPSLVLQGSTNTYTITDYDDFSEYTVSSSVGTITRDGDTITLEIPSGATGNTVAMSVTRNASTRVFQLALESIGVATPSITSPQEGATGVPYSTTLQGTPFVTAPVGVGVHTSSEWQVARDVGFTDIVVSDTVTGGNMTRFSAESLPRGTKLYARVRYVSDIGTSSWSVPVSFTTTVMQIDKPSVTIVGTSIDVKETPTFNSSAFSATPAGSDTHVASTWVLRKQEDESIVWQLQVSTSNRLSVTIPKGVLEEAEIYTMEVQYIGGFGTSSFSDKLTFITAQSFVPDEVGVPFGGGYYAGRIMVDGVEYALVVAPKTQGGNGQRQWSTTNTTTVGADSRNDGWANTQAMIQAGSALHPAAAFCRGLDINGYDDWYLPSKDELELCYRAFKPLDSPTNDTTSGANPSAIPPTGNYTVRNPPVTNNELFKQLGAEAFGGYYWSSTQHSSSQAWGQWFAHGEQRTLAKTNTGYFVRAVRRVAV